MVDWPFFIFWQLAISFRFLGKMHSLGILSECKVCRFPGKMNIWQILCNLHFYFSYFICLFIIFFAEQTSLSESWLVANSFLFSGRFAKSFGFFRDYLVYGGFMEACKIFRVLGILQSLVFLKYWLKDDSWQNIFSDFHSW